MASEMYLNDVDFTKSSLKKKKKNKSEKMNFQACPHLGINYFFFTTYRGKIND